MTAATAARACAWNGGRRPRSRSRALPFGPSESACGCSASQGFAELERPVGGDPVDAGRGLPLRRLGVVHGPRIELQARRVHLAGEGRVDRELPLEIESVEAGAPALLDQDVELGRLLRLRIVLRA